MFWTIASLLGWVFFALHLRRRLRSLEARLAAIEPARLDAQLAAGDRAIAAAEAAEPDEVDRRCARLADAEVLLQAGLTPEWSRKEGYSLRDSCNHRRLPRLRLWAHLNTSRPSYEAELYRDEGPFERRKLSGYLPVGTSLSDVEAEAERAGALLLELHERGR